MFTGIIQAVGNLLALRHHGAGARVAVEAPSEFDLAHKVNIGDSVACNGVCLTAATVEGNKFEADVSSETLACTCFGSYRTGKFLNLELACTPNTHLGGHIVQGHVDGVGRILSVSRGSGSLDVRVAYPPEIGRYIAHKGSIAVDGISLTVNEVTETDFRLTLIPHTLHNTDISEWELGVKVNLEVDVVARYVERLMTVKNAGGQVSGGKDSGSSDFGRTLAENGFL